METLSTLSALAERIANLHHEIQRATVQQVNSGLTARNWLIGFYIFEYEQHGADRAAYGERLLQSLAAQAKTREVAGLSYSALKTCRQFYQAYPQIGQTVSDQLQRIGLQVTTLLPHPAEAPVSAVATRQDFPNTNPDLLLSRLSFSHFIELLKADSALKRAFYEVQTISNNWSVRELKRAMETSLYERTGLSKDKAAVLAAHSRSGAADARRHPARAIRVGVSATARQPRLPRERPGNGHRRSARTLSARNGPRVLL